MKDTQQIACVLDKCIEAFKVAYGEPEYKYGKLFISYNPINKRQRAHFTPCRDPEPVTREEYEQNITKSNQDDHAAFIGELKAPYWRYVRTISKPGWKQELMDAVVRITEAQIRPCVRIPTPSPTSSD
ncbi:MAG: hypothetical protein LLG01_00855 [Planctomycetaceae bacterium]|nr:hypothetical protein [Planctomycetaceae bacterium]